MQIVGPREVWPLGLLCRHSLVLGMGLFMPAVLGSCFIHAWVDIGKGLKSPPSIVGGLGIGYGLIATLVVIWSLIRWRIQLATMERRVIASFFVVVGMLLVPLMMFVACELQRYASSPVGMPMSTSYLLWWPGAHAALLLIWNALSLLIWPIVARNEPFIIQDGSSCPQCGYCVRGVTSRICPECGSTFDHAQLGLSIAEFERLISGSMQVGDPESGQ